jgi:hypothetical protein
MRTLIVVIVALALGVLAAATAPKAEPTGVAAAQAAQTAQAQPEKVVIKKIMTASKGTVRVRLSVKETIQPPNATWTATADGTKAVDLVHSGACPATVRIGPALLLRPEAEPLGVRGRMVTTRFDSSLARSLVVRFFDGGTFGEQIVGKRTGSERIAGRLAAFAGSAGVNSGLKSSLELQVSGRFGTGCDAAGRDAVLADLDVILAGKRGAQFPAVALYFRNLPA